MELQNAERTLFARVRSGSSAEASSVEEEVPEGRTLPLMSSRVTITYLRRIARALALPTKGTKTELLTTIEGRLVKSTKFRTYRSSYKRGNLESDCS